MNNKTIEEIIELQDKELYFLFNELLMSNLYLGMELTLRTIKSRKLDYEDLQPHLEKGIAISQIIKRRPVIEREDYFLTQASIFCNTIKSENYELSGKILKDLSYFQHCFLEDSELRKIKLHHEILREALQHQ